MFDYFLFNLLFISPININPKTPPKNETIQLILNSEPLNVPFCIIDKGLKPNRPNDFIKNILPKTPEIVLPIRPNEYFFRINPVVFAPIIPIKILIKEINVSVIENCLY